MTDNLMFSLVTYLHSTVSASDFIFRVITFYTSAIALFLVKNVFLITKAKYTHYKGKIGKHT